MNQLQQTLMLDILEKYSKKRDKIISIRPLSGGDINQAFKIETGEGFWFAKCNRADSFPAMFEAEAKGLDLLGSAAEILIPEVIGFGTHDNESMLVLEFIQPGRENADFWTNFGRNMARLHRHSSDEFGLDYDNYIGSLPQYNENRAEWIEFFIQNRLGPQIKMARDAFKIDSSDIKKFENLHPVLADFFPLEKPSLLHGDLWSGNYMSHSSGQACIMDPAVYYGHRLMDLGMTKLFGGFTNEFYTAYNDEYQLDKNWIDSIEIANIYPLMVHVNLFGGGYLGSVMRILKKFK
jgi:protein-ribulosamine 3-kinase